MFHAVAAVLVLGLVLMLWRTQGGAVLDGIELGPGGSVIRIDPDAQAIASKGSMSARHKIQRGDRIVHIAGRPVNSLAEVTDVLWELDPENLPKVKPSTEPSNAGNSEFPGLEQPEPDPSDEPTPGDEDGEDGEDAAKPSSKPSGGQPLVPVNIERYGWRFSETLTYQDVVDNGLPSSIDPNDRVVGYEQAQSEVDLENIVSVLRRNPTEPKTFHFERPVHVYATKVALTEPSLWLWPWMLMIVAVGVVWLARLRWKEAQTDELRGMWEMMACSAAAAPWVLMFLSSPPRTLQDPILLAVALLALAMYRPLSLDVHRRLWAGGVSSSVLTAGLVFPALVMAFIGIFRVAPLLPALWGSSVTTQAEYEVIALLEMGVIMIALYHVLDLALWLRFRWRRSGDEPKAPNFRAFLGPEVGLWISSLALITALSDWVYGLMPGNGSIFLEGRFADHATALVLILWLGDLALVAMPPKAADLVEATDAVPEASDDEARDLLVAFLEKVASSLKVDDAELVVVRGKLAMVMRPVMQSTNDAEPTETNPEGLRWTQGLQVNRAPEELRAAIGLLREERVSLPLPEIDSQGREEHQGESALTADVVKNVVEKLKVHVAFCVLDESDLFAYPTHEQREQTFYVYLIAREPAGRLMTFEEVAQQREDFESLWPYSRQLLVTSLLNELGDGAWIEPEQRPLYEAEAALARGEDPQEALERAQEQQERAAEPPPELSLDDVFEKFTRADLRTHIMTKEEQLGLIELPYLRRDMAETYPVLEEDLIERHLEEHIKALAASDAPIAIVGPPGIGKEFVARKIHAFGPLNDGPFVKFSVASCPPSLRSLELLGDGQDYVGYLGASAGGVLFVEDAQELEDALLDRLLRTLPRLEDPVLLIMSLRTSPMESSREVVAHLPSMFGELLRGVLEAQTIYLEPLHARFPLIHSLADYYSIKFAMKHSRMVTELAPSTLRALEGWIWMGGIEELKRVLEVAVLRCDGQTLYPEHLPLPGISTPENALGAPAQFPQSSAPLSPMTKADLGPLAENTLDLKDLLLNAQAAIFREALEREGGNKTSAARLVGVSRSVFTRILKEHSVE